nr:CoA pyrophosphatase [Alkalicoccus halolimnae]
MNIRKGGAFLNQLSKDVYYYFQRRKASVLDSENYRRYSIFVPLMRINGSVHVIFEVRSDHVPQPGEICFPGGKVDKTDLTASDAAVRELCEEIGVSSQSVSITGELDYLVTPSKSMIFAYLGEIVEDESFHVNPDEVKEIFTVPLKDLMNITPQEHKINLSVQPEEGFPYHLIPNGEKYPWSAGIIHEKFYRINGYIIWGLTARILHHALEEIKKAGSSSF